MTLEDADPELPLYEGRGAQRSAVISSLLGIQVYILTVILRLLRLLGRVMP